MPELPEVETACRVMRQALQGKRITRVEVVPDRSFDASGVYAPAPALHARATRPRYTPALHAAAPCSRKRCTLHAHTVHELWPEMLEYRLGGARTKEGLVVPVPAAGVFSCGPAAAAIRWASTCGSGGGVFLFSLLLRVGLEPPPCRACHATPPRRGNRLRQPLLPSLLLRLPHRRQNRATQSM
jgi:hypothetical protein